MKRKEPTPLKCTLRVRSVHYVTIADFPRELRGTVTDIVEAMCEDEDWLTDGLFIQPDAIQVACIDPDPVQDTRNAQDILTVIRMLRENRAWLTARVVGQ